jgi:exopolysaccharide biosynthesis predicted pyruvyltransferase EpsI
MGDCAKLNSNTYRDATLVFKRSRSERSGFMITSCSESPRTAGKSGPNGGVQTTEKQAEATIERLHGEIGRVLGPELDGVRSLALVDVPDYTNVGDNAIYLGELGWLQRRHGLVPRYVCTINNFSAEALQQAVPEGPILIHGGGNFGDIWPYNQQVREEVLMAFPGRRIVQLPQSIHFDNLAAQDRAAEKIAAHGNVLLLVRDHKSFDLARNAFKCDVRLCPDMALALGLLPRPAEARHELLLLLRTDKEKADHNPLPVLPVEAVVADWLDEPAYLRERLRRWSVCRAALVAPARSFDRNYQCERFYRALATHRMARGLRLLASGRMVITDRLHGHILCLLLGIPHIAFDNNYGKVGSFIETWTADCGLVERTGSLAEALDGLKKGVE